MTEKRVTTKNRAGIHARPASLIVKVATKFASKISMIKEAENETINAKSIMGIITLAAGYNTSLLIRAEGPDEAEAVQALSDLFERRFEED
ncbi:MAG: HPr family phosphocarrier protein [Spirochaetales bacterium]|jgi:phosphocarrier protein|nr:HPr family phosphocarrier protein [Spirochaetales bacterium]